MRAALALALVATACGDNSDQGNAVFAWDANRVLGAWRIDHLGPRDPDTMAMVDDRVVDGNVGVFYGHLHDDLTTPETIEGLLARAAADDVPTLTFQDLASGPPRAGIALSFDDADYAAWTAMRPLFARYHARVTFFVTRYPYATADDRAAVRALADDGHDIEAHGVDHANAIAYAAQHGLDALLHDQILPSLDALEADGYAPCCYAHPGGATTAAIDAAILATGRVALVRRITTP